MAKIKRTVGPSVGAPDLTRNLQNINIPRDAFGANVGSELANLGGTVADVSNKLNLAFGRMEERRSTTRANSAFKDVSINQNNALDVAKQEAIKNPALLPTFQAEQTKRFDEDMKAITDPMDKRTKLKYDIMANSLRTSLAKNGITWARGQEVVNGRNEMNAVVAGMVATASQVNDTEDLKQQIAGRLTQGQLDGVLIDGRGRPQDLNIEINKARRQVDINKANSLVDKFPALLKTMLDDPDQLPDLTDKDEKDFIRESITSFNNVQTKAAVSEIMSKLAADPDLLAKHKARTLTLLELDARTDLSDSALKYYRDQIIGEEPTTSAQRIEKKTQAKIETERANQATDEFFRRERQIEEETRVTEEDKLNKKYMEVAEIIESKKIVDTVELLTKVAEFTDATYQAKNDGLNTTQFEDTVTELIPLLPLMIDSKHLDEFRERSGFGSTLLNAASGRFAALMFKDDSGSPKNLVVDNFKEVLSLLERTGINDERSRVRTFGKVVRLLKEANDIEDPEKKKEARENVAREAVRELLEDKGFDTKRFDGFIEGIDFGQSPNVVPEQPLSQSEEDRLQLLIGGK